MPDLIERDATPSRGEPPLTGGGTDTAEHARLRRRAHVGAWILGVRSVFQQLTVLAGNVYLARQLSPAEFGIFVIVQFALSFFAVLGDAGIAPALIQQRTAPSDQQLSTVWWLQVGISLVVVVLLFAAAPALVHIWPEFPAGGASLLRAVSATLFLTALRVVPSVLLERQLRFAALSVVEFVGTVVFYTTAVVLARRGLGVGALVWAMIAQAGVGAVAMNVISPYVPSRVFAVVHVRSLLRFGFAYQGKTLASFANSAVTPLIGGTMLGSHLLGLNNFAQNLAYFPLNLVNIISRVSFPLYSRLQDDREALAAEITSSIRLSGSATLMFVGLCFGLGPNIVSVVYGDKWLPSLPLIYVYATVITVGFLSPVIGAAFDAIGKPQVLFRMASAWTLLNWCAVLLGTAYYKTMLAFAIAYGLHVVVGNLALVYVARRVAPGMRVFRPILASAGGALASSAFGYYVLSPWARGVTSLIAAILASALVFGAFLAAVDRSWLRAVIALLARTRTKKTEAVPTSTA